MSLTKEQLVSRINIVQEFNNRLWKTILGNAGNKVYHAGTNNVVTGDELQTTSGTSKITLYAVPRFSGTSRYGSQDTTGTGVVKETNPVAVPVQHLQNIPANKRVKLTLHKDDLVIDANGDVPALTIYNACFSILQALIHVRPFKSRWIHESSFSDKRIDKQFSSAFAYALYIDNPRNIDSSIPTQRAGNWGQGYSLSYWAINRGSNIASLTTAAVPTNGVVKGLLQTAESMNGLIDNIWKAWQERCKEQNSFDYTYYSCHLNCHSSCHSSCHGSRSRR